jgi:hypothetical protein
VISKAVFVVENAIIDKEMHSHKLSAMADNYPADWCINQMIWWERSQDHSSQNACTSGHEAR